MKLGCQGQVDALKKTRCRYELKMSPVLFLDWGTRFQSSKIVILITSLQIVILTSNFLVFRGKLIRCKR